MTTENNIAYLKKIRRMLTCHITHLTAGQAEEIQTLVTELARRKPADAPETDAEPNRTGGSQGAQG